MAELLVQQGFHVVQAADGSEAFSRLTDLHPPSLIVLDLSMPVMDGEEFLRLIKENVRYAAVPVLLVSATDAAMLPAASGLLRKPFDVAVLLEMIQDIVH